MRANLIWKTTTALAAVAFAMPVWAQAADQAPASQAASQGTDSGQLTDIVVTARKTTENNQRAPASIVAMNGTELAERGVTDLQSLDKVLPSATLRTQGSVVQVFIRGIGTRSDLPNFAGATVFNFNGITVQRYGTFGLTFDPDRIESIAGPQGTLYGASAAGGAINVFSARPTGDNSGYASVLVGDYDTVQASADQNVALTDKVSVRGSFDINRRGDSYFRDDLDTDNNYGVRLSMLIKPTDNLDINVFYNHVGDTGKPNNTLISIPLIQPGNPYYIPPTGSGGNPIDGAFTHQDNRSNIIGANVVWHAGENDFTYIPGYVNFISDIVHYSGNTGSLLQVYDHERQHSEELRWNRTAGAFKLSAGLFYSQDLINYNDSQINFTSPTKSSTTPLNVTSQRDLSEAAYAQVVYSATDRLRITAGGRISWDKMVATGTGAAGVPIDFNHSHAQPDYKLGVDYDLAPRVMVYANFQTGYIPFGYNPDVLGNPIVPESRLTAYSGGFKSRFFDNRVELNVEGFYYNYSNFQAIQFVATTGLSTVLSAKKSTILGVDVSARAQITPTTHFNLGALLQRPRYDDFSGVGYDYSGNELINAPKLNLQAGLDQTAHLGSFGKLVGEVDTHYESGHYGTFDNFLSGRQPRYTMTDFSLSWSPVGDRFTIQGYVHNIENAVVFTTLSAGKTATAPGHSGLEAPRTYGVRLSARW
jgi:iron complex outermembrane receptor protein